MDALLTHLQEYWIGYVFLVGGLVPVIYFTRQYTLPVIQWTAELCIYSAIMHVVVHGLVRLTAWFKEQSQFERAFDVEAARPDWRTPLLEFWNKEAYNPDWLFWVEVAFVIVAIVLMFKYRPMKTQKILPRRPNISKGVTPGKDWPGMQSKGKWRS